MITTVVFDFGNVVGWFSHRRSAEQMAALCGADAAEVLAFLYGGPLEGDFDGGRLETAAYRDLVRRRFGLAVDDAVFDRALGDMFEPNTEVCGLLPALRRRHRLLLLSNTNAIHAAAFRPQFAGHLAYFDHVVLSYEVRLSKPDPALYRHCGRLAGARPEACVFVDDLPANVAGARACGWHGVVYRPGTLVDELARLGVSGSEGPPAA
jgi:putative hydrolase of the HAD superfamily